MFRDFPGKTVGMDVEAQGSDEPKVVEIASQPTAVVRGSVPAGSLREFFDQAFHELGEAVARGVFSPVGPALALYVSPPGSTVELEVGFPVRRPIVRVGSVVPSTLPGVQAVTCTHRGNYDDLEQAYGRLRGWAGEHAVRLGTPLWELYVTEPSPGADPADMVTELYWALGDVVARGQPGHLPP